MKKYYIDINGIKNLNKDISLKIQLVDHIMALYILDTIKVYRIKEIEEQLSDVLEKEFEKEEIYDLIQDLLTFGVLKEVHIPQGKTITVTKKLRLERRENQ